MRVLPAVRVSHSHCAFLVKANPSLNVEERVHHSAATTTRAQPKNVPLL